MTAAPDDPEQLRAAAGPLRALRQRRRRLASACFFVAGVGFGTAIYLLRARFVLVRAGKQLTFLALLAVTVAAFWLGARAEAEVGQLEEQIRDLEERASARLRR